MRKGSHRRTWTSGAAISPRLGSSRDLATFAAIFAILLQALLVQTHVHRPGEAGAPLAFAGQSLGDTDQKSPHVAMPKPAQGECVLCETMAAAGSAVLVSAVAVAATHGPIPFAPARIVASPPRIDAHPWQSRAPPRHV
ncbi:MAG TPA: hypothetical protein VG943_13100 [Caulobacterales bacterium]|nr:hypothetical protein [Caulobacterales bacterium]